MSGVHRKINGQLLNLNKRFRDLKFSQRDKIANWLYNEYKEYRCEKNRLPNKPGDEAILSAVMKKIDDAGIWIPEREVYLYYIRKKYHLRKRFEKEMAL